MFSYLLSPVEKTRLAYFLHRYYPENRGNITKLDWEIYLELTNCICGKSHLVFSLEQARRFLSLPKEYLKLFYDSYFSTPSFIVHLEEYVRVNDSLSKDLGA